MENVSYHVAAGNIDKDLLHEIISAVIKGDENEEGLKLKIQFDAKPDFQREAINAVVDITGDWQLGMLRHFSTEGVQERFTQFRFNVLRGLRITWINSPRARSQEKYGLHWNRNRE